MSSSAAIRVGGGYRLAFRTGPSQSMEFFGTYIDVTPCSRLAWTNDEAGDAGAVTTVTFEDHGEKTRIVLLDLYPSKEALEAGRGAYDGMEETFGQLEELLVALAE